MAVRIGYFLGEPKLSATQVSQTLFLRRLHVREHHKSNNFSFFSQSIDFLSQITEDDLDNAMKQQILAIICIVKNPKSIENRGEKVNEQPIL